MATPLRMSVLIPVLLTTSRYPAESLGAPRRYIGTHWPWPPGGHLHPGPQPTPPVHNAVHKTGGGVVVIGGGEGVSGSTQTPEPSHFPLFPQGVPAGSSPICKQPTSCLIPAGLHG